MRPKALVTQRLRKILGKDACQGKNRGTARIGSQLCIKGRCHGIDLEFEGKIDGKGRHQDSSSNMSRTNG